MGVPVVLSYVSNCYATSWAVKQTINAYSEFVFWALVTEMTNWAVTQKPFLDGTHVSLKYIQDRTTDANHEWTISCMILRIALS